MTIINQNSKLKYKPKAVPKEIPKLIFYEVIVELYEKEYGVVIEKGKYIGRELVFLSSTSERLAHRKTRAINTLSVFPGNVIASPIYKTLKVTKHIAIKDMKHIPLNEESKSKKKITVEPEEQTPFKKEKSKPKEPKVDESILSKAEQEKLNKKKRFEELNAIAIESSRLYALEQEVCFI